MFFQDQLPSVYLIRIRRFQTSYIDRNSSSAGIYLYITRMMPLLMGKRLGNITLERVSNLISTVVLSDDWKGPTVHDNSLGYVPHGKCDTRYGSGQTAVLQAPTCRLPTFKHWINNN